MKKRFVVVCAFAASAAALAFGQDGPAPTDKAAPERPQITETKPESEAKLPPKWDRESMPPRERQFERGDKGPRGELGRRGPQGAPDRGFRGDMRKGDGPREGKMGANGNGPKDFKGPREGMQGREGKGPKDFNGPREGMRGHEGKGPVADAQAPEGDRPNPKEAQAPEEAQDGDVIETEERRMERMDRRGGRPDGFEGRRGDRRGSHGDVSPERKVQELQVSPEA